jgi:hypothetical protein
VVHNFSKYANHTFSRFKDGSSIAVDMNSYSSENKNTKTRQMARCVFHTPNNFRRDLEISIVMQGCNQIKPVLVQQLVKEHYALINHLTLVDARI